MKKRVAPKTAMLVEKADIAIQTENHASAASIILRRPMRSPIAPAPRAPKRMPIIV